MSMLGQSKWGVSSHGCQDCKLDNRAREVLWWWYFSNISWHSTLPLLCHISKFNIYDTLRTRTPAAADHGCSFPGLMALPIYYLLDYYLYDACISISTQFLFGSELSISITRGTWWPDGIRAGLDSIVGWATRPQTAVVVWASWSIQ